MRLIQLRSLALGALIVQSLFAQDWDPQKNAALWANQDQAGFFVFHDPNTKSLMSWDRGGGVVTTVSIAKMNGSNAPERWVLDSHDRAHVISGNLLTQIDKDGKVANTEKLPAEVTDIVQDSSGFILSYKTLQPYLEKRDYRNGGVVWSYGSKPKKDAFPGRTMHRIAISVRGPESQIYLAQSQGCMFLIIDGAKGKELGQIVPSFNQGAAPTLDLSNGERREVRYWIGKSVLFSVVSSAQVPKSVATFNGLGLARLDTAQSSITFLSTGLSEDHLFIGVTDGEAVFLAPKGGLVYLPVK
jgi:hypothetical protein